MAITLCWSCTKATGGCVWSQTLSDLVSGCVAEPKNRRYKDAIEQAYTILECPEYEKDPRCSSSCTGNCYWCVPDLLKQEETVHDT